MEGGGEKEGEGRGETEGREGGERGRGEREGREGGMAPGYNDKDHSNEYQENKSHDDLVCSHTANEGPQMSVCYPQVGLHVVHPLVYLDDLLSLLCHLHQGSCSQLLRLIHLLGHPPQPVDVIGLNVCCLLEDLVVVHLWSCRDKLVIDIECSD